MALDPRVRQMAIARAINTGGMSLVMSFLGVYVVVDRGYAPWLYGVCALGANIAQSLTAAWAGDLSDRIGRRPLVTGSLLVRAAVIAVLGLQVILDAPLWSIALNFVASSALRGCFEPVAYALVADVVRPEDRIAAYGLQRMGTNFGWALGPAVGGLLNLFIPYGYIFFVAAAGLCAAAFATTGVPESRAPRALEVRSLRERLREAWDHPLLLALLANGFLFALVHTQLFSTFAIYMDGELHVGKLRIGLLYMINGVAVIALQMGAIGFIRRIGIDRALVVAGLAYTCGDLLVGAAIGFASAAAAIVVLTCAEIVLAPAQQTAAVEISDPDRRGRTFGTLELASNLGVAFGPLVGTSLYGSVGHIHEAMWGTIAGIALLLAVTGAVFGRLRRRAAVGDVGHRS